jgi:hypothetical protein
MKGNQSMLMDQQALEFIVNNKYTSYSKTLNTSESVSRSEDDKRKRNLKSKAGDKEKKNKIDNDRGSLEKKR